MRAPATYSLHDGHLGGRGVLVATSSVHGRSILVGRRRLLTLISAQLATTAALAPVRTARASFQTDTQPASAPAHDIAVALAFEQRERAVSWGDQPFGAVIVQAGGVVGEGPSRVIVNGDPTAHAEMEAVRDACSRLDARGLSGCVIYATSRPCRMCDAVLAWARVSRVYVGSDGADAGLPGSGPCS